jgi:hypothetical protein
LAGYEIYQPLLREQRRSHGRKITVTAPLFPGYTFVLIVSGWWNARWAAGVRRLVMDGLQPARVPDGVIAEIRSRERGGLIELPKLRLEPGARVRVLQGPLRDQIGLLGGCGSLISSSAKKGKPRRGSFSEALHALLNWWLGPAGPSDVSIGNASTARPNRSQLCHCAVPHASCSAAHRK